MCQLPPDVRSKAERAVLSGKSFSAVARSVSLSGFQVTHHMRNHVGGSEDMPRDSSSKVTGSHKRIEAHIADIEKRITSEKDPLLLARLLAERGRAIDRLAKVKGDQLVGNVAVFASRLGFPSPEALAEYVKSTQYAERVGTQEAVDLAARLIRAWNAAHPDRSVEVRVATRRRWQPTCQNLTSMPDSQDTPGQ